MRKIDYIIIHHSLSNDTKTRNFDAIRKYHMKTKRWNDIGYHYVVEDVEGEAVSFFGRPVKKMGAHVKGMNKNTIGVCIVGNYDRDEVPEHLWEVAVQLVNVLRIRFGICRSNVLGHWEAQKKQGIPYERRKSCPGLFFDMKKFRKDV